MAAGISSLSSELHLALFKSLDNFADVSALMRTSQHFHAIWTVHTTSICSAVLPQVIDCLTEAKELIESQERFSSYLQKKTKQTVEIVRVKMLLENQRIAYRAIRGMKADYQGNPAQYERILPFIDTNPANEIRFLRCLYRFWAVIHAGLMTPDPRQYFLYVKSYKSFWQNPVVALRARTVMVRICDQRRRVFGSEADVKVWEVVDKVFAEMGQFVAKEQRLRDSSPEPRRGRGTKWLMANIFHDLLTTPGSSHQG